MPEFQKSVIQSGSVTHVDIADCVPGRILENGKYFLFQGDIESEGLTKQKFKEEDLDLESMDHLDYEQYRLGFCDKIILSLFQIFPQEKNWPKKDQSV